MMDYAFKAVLIVSVLACIVMAEAFWSSLHNKKSLLHSFYKSVVMGSVFLIYAVIDYLLIVPGANFLIA